jgi:hypothetical protein
MASKKNQRMGSVRHKDVCGLLKTWCGVAKGDVTAEDCQQVCECMRLCLCRHLNALSLADAGTGSNVYTHIHTLTLSLSHTSSTQLIIS